MIKNKKVSMGGILLIILGSIFFLKNFIDIPLDIKWEYIWPIILIVWGVKLLVNKR